jgi:F-type H+-transporting ATPase subunit gamma
MAVPTRLIRRRIRSITNTKKITKAMELVAAAKMRRAISSVLATRPYANSAWRAVEEIAKTSDPSAHPLLKPGASPRTLVILVSTDRGLCGGINSRLFRALAEFSSGRDCDFVAVGRKGLSWLKRRSLPVVASFSDLGHNVRSSETAPIAKLSMDDFTSGKYGSVWVAFTDYRSTMRQDPMVRRLLPIARVEVLGEVEGAVKGVEKPAETKGESFSSSRLEYLFEPSAAEVLSNMLPRLVEVQVYQAVLESVASEQSARMMAMRSASDAAVDMISSLTLTLNQARQAGITMEIAEISSGKAALEMSR